MRILVTNKFMYPRGGDCIVALNTAELLRKEGHEVRLFAMDYPENLQLEDSRDYASRVSFEGSVKDKLKAFGRVMGKGDIRKSFRKVMRDFKPDVVHLHNIHSYLSPVIGEIASEMGAKVVWTLHDYKLLCPAYSCRRPDGSNCDECFNGKLSVLKNRCMKGSLAGSVIAHLEAKKWSRRKVAEFTSAFICPSEFMGECMIKGGFEPKKIKVLTNFADPKKYNDYEPAKTPQPYFCYIGRLSEEKGVVTLLKAAKQTGIHLKIAGGGPLLESLKKEYSGVENIEFLGHLDSKGVAETLRNAMASVMPSECYENNPLGVIESLCLGTPVIGANIGGIPELLRNGDGICRGMTFPSGDVEALTNIFCNFEADKYDREKIATEARKVFSQETHLNKLMEIYNS